MRDTIDGIEVTCVDNGMPVALALAGSFGLPGYERQAWGLKTIESFDTRGTPPVAQTP